ncbi:MAG: ATP-dependent DNA ligase [Rhodoferax sp.]|nr:ATP-dependent DNA ligase [Rhodoferax sp.]
MKAFADLYARLDATTSSNAKLLALQQYFHAAPQADAAWAVFFLAGGRPRQLVASKLLRQMALDAAGLPEWLFDESYQAVGDLAETIALLLPESQQLSEDGLAIWVEDKLLPLRALAPQRVNERLLPLLLQLDRRAQLVCIKLITGSLRVGVSKLLVTRALSALTGIDAKRIAQRLVGYTGVAARPSADHFARLVAAVAEGEEDTRDTGQPYPFFLAHPLQLASVDFDQVLGPPGKWQVEWKWDGIRAQLVKRAGQLWVWTRGEELVTERFPELAALAMYLPDGTVLDGEIVVWSDGPAASPALAQGGPGPDVPAGTPGSIPTDARGTVPALSLRVLSFALLQQRIGRKTLSARLLREVPVVLLAYDLLEWEGRDWRQHAQTERRAQLECVVAQCRQSALRLSPLLHGDDWAELERQRTFSRLLGVEGLMLKAVDAHYGVGRTKNVGVWWKWKIDPYSVDAVLVYAQRGHGRRASLYTDFTFAVWDSPEYAPGRTLVPFAKAYSGLTDAEMRAVDVIVRKTTLEKFGPVRSVTPTMVFELGFEGIALSLRHKSGIAVRFPRILRWRRDKQVAQADTLATLRALLPMPAASHQPVAASADGANAAMPADDTGPSSPTQS